MHFPGRFDVLIDYQEILRYLRHIKEFWSYLLQQDNTAMERVDQATVKALELTAPWASTVDAQILRGKVLGGEVFCTFNQREREEIWIRLQSFKGLVPSLYGFFEDVKVLEAWANCLKWVIRLGPRDTVSTALKKIYTDTNQDTGSALVQKTETTFMPVPANLTYRMGLGCRQLQAFAMRYHREIPKKPSGKNLLARPMAIVDTTKLREMADLANRLWFESSDIVALKQYSNSTDSTAVIENNRPILVTAGPGETREQRCGMPHIQSYKDDRQFLFLTHLHDDRDEQSEGITSFFRLRSVYLNFYGMPSHALRTIDHSSSQQHLTPVTEEAVYQASHISPSAYSPTQSQIREPEHMNVDVEEDERQQTEDTVMHEGEGEEQRPSLQVQGVLAQETIIQEQQRQKLLFDASTLKRQTQEQEHYRQNLLRDASALREQEQKQEQQRQKLLFDTSTLEKQEQEQEQEQYRQKLTRDANAFKEQEQEQEQQSQKLLFDVSTLEKQEQEQEQEQRSQKLLCDVSTLEKQEQEQEQYLQKLAGDASALREQEQEQERRRQKRISDASTLKEQEQQQEQMYQKLTVEANVLREQEQGREEQRQNLATEESKLINWKQKQEEQRQTLATVANELVNQEQRQEEQRKNLAEYASDLKNQTLRHNEQRQKLTANISELNKQEKRQKKLKRDKLRQKRELKSVEQKVLGSKQNKPEAIQEREEPDIEKLQRQGQDGLTDLKSSPSLEPEHEGVSDQITYEVRAKNYSIDAVQKGGTQVGVSAPKGENSSAKDHGLQQDGTQEDGAQEQVQEGRQNEEAKEDRLYKAEAQENEANEIRAEERGREHRVQEDGQEDEAHEAGARNDMAQGGTQADGAQEAGQEDKAHKNGQDGGAYEYQASKRRAVTEESEDGGALRAQQVREGRKPVEKGKYQRLNRFRPLSHDMNSEGDTSMDGTEEGDTTPMPRKKPQTLRRQQRQDQQTQQRAKNATAAAATGNTNGSTRLTSDFTFEAQQASSQGT